ncbi:MAG: hypothetical protein ACXVAK_04745 [Vulcanimicrobiaceae bacterium]
MRLWHLFFGLAFWSALAAASVSIASGATHAPSSVSVAVTTPDGSGPIGAAILSQKASGVLVTVKFAPRMPINARAAIYKGNCTSPGSGAVAYTLKPVTGGLSETMLHGVSVATLTSRGYSVVLNYTPRLCGDLRKANPISNF